MEKNTTEKKSTPIRFFFRVSARVKKNIFCPTVSASGIFFLFAKFVYEILPFRYPFAIKIISQNLLQIHTAKWFTFWQNQFYQEKSIQ